MGQSLAHIASALDEAVDDRAGHAFAFLGDLVRAASVLGGELEAQELVAAELERLGFATRMLTVPDDIAERDGAGVPRLAYDDRPVVVGERAGSGRSLLLNGHVDVVPPGARPAWHGDPFEPVVRDGWLLGRGAGDMKGGFAMALLALEAVLEVAPSSARGPVSFVSAIEEECTGNGTLAAVRAGVVADAALLPEPTGLELLLEGIGILWFELVVSGRPTHAQDPGAGANAIELALPLISGLRELEREANAAGGRHALNVGTFRGGDWQSSVPGEATIGVRLGFPRAWSVAEAEARVRAAVARAAESDPWLARNPPRLRFNGFRAEGYALDRRHPLAEAVAAAHRDVLGTEPAVSAGTATTDARYYVNQAGIPALCYGPRARNIHGIDEAVELESIVVGARVLARFLLRYLGEEA
ncbi:MAG TPA: ArgE/DapE family deacylase [Gaiellaceae bacterium]